jgi:carbon starvation protein
VQTIWPMFGIANQLLAVVALAVGTTYILRERGPRPALVTFLPLCFVGATTITAGVQGIARIYLPLARSGDPEKALQGWSSTAFTAVLLGCVAFILAFAIARWARLLRDPGGASGARLAAAE